MRGGEIFVPKIPSMRITDLATAVCAHCEHEIIGIRPGEKVHELLITRDDARCSLEFGDYYIIQPPVPFWRSESSEVMNYGGEKGKTVASDFEYASDTNVKWLDVDALRSIIE